MQEKKWFIIEKDQISGPFTPTDIFNRLNKGELKEAQFWAKQKTQWMNESDFREEVRRDEDSLKRMHSARAANEWKVKTPDQQLGPLAYPQLIDFLKKQTELGNIKIWTEGYEEWRDVYSVYKILDDLGVNRRQHPRVAIQGVLLIEHTGGLIEVPLTTISEGGCGISKGYKLNIGDKFKGTVSSPALPHKIHCAAEVVYMGTDAECGLKFSNISMEGKSAIIDYVRKLSREAQG